jgi:hypothetical protein
MTSQIFEGANASPAQACTSQKVLGLAWAGEAFAPSAWIFILIFFEINLSCVFTSQSIIAKCQQVLVMGKKILVASDKLFGEVGFFSMLPPCF